MAHEVPVEQLRPLAALHVMRAYARDVIDALASSSVAVWSAVVTAVGKALVDLTREKQCSPSRKRIAPKLGAIGA